MTESGARQRWIGLIALAWIILLGFAWLVVYDAVPLPHWAGIVRLVREFALLAFLLGAAYGWGRAALLRWHTPAGERPEPLRAIGLGFGLLWTATFCAAALHLLGPALPWLLIGSGWLAFLATIRPVPRPRLPDLATWTAGRWFLLAAMTISLGYSLLAWALVPPLAWDEVSYHLPIPQTYIEAGGFVPIPTIVHANWPAGMEMLDTLALLMGSEILPHLIVTAMVVLTALGLSGFARRHFGSSTAWLAAALYLTMPMVRYLAGVALIEGALGFFGFMALWSGYDWLESRSWRDLVLAGVFGGLVASIKLTAAAIPLAVGLVALVWLLLRDRERARRHLAQFVAYGAITLAVVAPWYLKSTVYTGNPVWPFLYNVFGGQYWDPLGDQLHTAWLHRPNLDPTFWNYVAGFWYLTVRADEFGGMKLGAAIVALVPLSALFLRGQRWLLAYLGAACAIVYTIWFFTTHQTRFLMGIIPALTLVAAFAFIQLLRHWPTRWRVLGRLGMAAYLIVLLPFSPGEGARITARWPYIAGSISREELLGQEVTGYSAFQFANEYLPADATVLLALWETRGYYLDRDAVWANPISQRVIKWEQFADAAALAEQLHQLGITHVFCNENQIIAGVPNEEHTSEILGTFLSEYGTILYDHPGFRVYELRTAP